MSNATQFRNLLLGSTSIYGLAAGGALWPNKSTVKTAGETATTEKEKAK